MTALLLALNLACGADAATTAIALDRGAHEVLLPSQSRVLTTAMLAGEAAGASAGLVWLDRRQHPKLARGLGWAIVAIRTAVVVHNVQQLRKAGRP